MNAKTRYIALIEVLLILPAALFMASLVLRHLTTPGLSDVAQRTVMWYAERQRSLWLLLVTLPLAVIVFGCATLLQRQNSERLRTGLRNPLAANLANGTTKFIASLTCVAAAILAVVGLHILAN